MENKNQRTIIIAVIVVLLLCCLCAFVLSGYFVWGDPLMEYLGVI